MGVLDEDLDESASRGVAAQNDLEERIRLGLLPVGEKLPSQRALSTQYGVAKSTMQVVIQHLTVKGLVRTEPGRGTYVAPRHAEDFIALGELEPTRLDEPGAGMMLAEEETKALNDPADRGRAELIGRVFFRTNELLARASSFDVHDEGPSVIVLSWRAGPTLKDMVSELTPHAPTGSGRSWHGVPGLRLVRRSPEEADFLWNARVPLRLILRRELD